MSNLSEVSKHVTRKQSLHVPQEVVMRDFSHHIFSVPQLGIGPLC